MMRMAQYNNSCLKTGYIFRTTQKINLLSFSDFVCLSSGDEVFETLLVICLNSNKWSTNISYIRLQ